MSFEKFTLNMTMPLNIQFGFILTRVLCLDETTLPSVSQGTCAVSDRGSDCTHQAGVTGFTAV